MAMTSAFSLRAIRIWCALKELSWVASNWSGDEVDHVQEMSEGRDDEMDGETCSE